MMKNCLLVAGGAVSAPLLKKIFREGDFQYVFAADRGLEALDACGIRPTHLVGDFDSVSPDILKKYLPEKLNHGKPDNCDGESALSDTANRDGEKVFFKAADHDGEENGSENRQEERNLVVERLIPEKDDTDTEHAMRQAAALLPDQILLVGGFGSRFDHVLANVHTLLIPLHAGIEACMVDETNCLRLLSESTFRIKKCDTWGKYISLLPLTAEVSGITLEGFKYPLTDATFRIGETISLGVSNELIAEEGFVTVGKGVLIVVESEDGRTE